MPKKRAATETSRKAKARKTTSRSRGRSLSHLSREKSEALWKAYVANRDERVRNQILEHYMPLVRRVAEKILSTLPKSVELDDLISAGTFGLIDAIDGFDIERGIQFKTYCTTRIRGAILDELRAQDWVPRLVRIRGHQLERARRALEVDLGREPTDIELARKLDLKPDELRRMREEADAKAIFSMSDSSEEDEGRREGLTRLGDPDALSPMEVFHRKDLFDVVTKGLTEKERFILHCYYYAGLTLKEIGKKLNLTESRVCQIHSNVMGRLRGSLENLRSRLVP